MGQRHQFFIIAKASGCYHVLAVIHHQWAYGTLPIRMCWRLLQMFGHAANQKLIRHELAHAATLSNDWWDQQADDARRYEVYENPDRELAVPFPYILTCLVAGCSFDPRAGDHAYATSVLPLPVGSAWQSMDNNDGFTLVDISDLDDLKYCFLQLGGWDPPHPIETPLTDEEYMDFYPESRIFPERPSLGAWKLIDANILRQLWPGDEWQDSLTHPVPSGAIMPPPAAVRPSFKELAFRKTVESALDDVVMAEEAFDLGQRLVFDFARQLLVYLTTHPDAATRSGGSRLLGRALQVAAATHDSLDLSPWPLLSEAEILRLAELAPVENLKTLDLSNNQNATARTVTALLGTCPKVTKIVLLNTPAVLAAELAGALAPFKIEEVWHSDVVRAALAKEKRDCKANGEGGLPLIAGSATQLVVHSNYSLRSRGVPHTECMENEVWSWQKAVQVLTERVAAARPWRGGLPHDLMIECMPLRDVFLGANRVAEWPAQIMQALCGHELLSPHIRGDSVIPALGTALAVGVQDPWRVFPIPAASFRGQNCFRDVIANAFVDITEGSWTILASTIYGGNPKGGLVLEECRYALMTRDSNGELVVADLDLFRAMTNQQPAGAADRTAAAPGLSSIDWTKVTCWSREDMVRVVDEFRPLYNAARAADGGGS